MAAMEFQGVTKRFRSTTALHDLDLTVEDGEIYGFLGPNGAGKSTTINIALDFVRPTSGNVTVLGENSQRDSVSVRQRVGVLPDDFHVYDRLSGRQHLRFAIESKNAGDDPDVIAERVGIAEAIGRTAGGYSKGMKQRLTLGMALAGEPELLILDEPSTGLDPNGAKQMRDIIREENARGATVFFSSHILEQVDAVCDRVGILRDGSLVAEDSISALRDAVGLGSTLEIEVSGDPEGIEDRLTALSGITSVEVGGSVITVRSNDGSKSAVLKTVEEYGLGIEDFSTTDASLEDLFMAYTEENQNRTEIETDGGDEPIEDGGTEMGVVR